jgi:hypothetical protein
MLGIYGKQFYKKYSENRHIIKLFLESKENNLLTLNKIINKEMMSLNSISNTIYKNTNNKFEILNLLRSYIHMSINRLMSSDNRIYEMFITDFLLRYYLEIINVNKNGK